MATMTKEQVIQLIKNTAGSDIAEMVRQSVATAIEPLKQEQTQWAERLMGERKEDKKERTREPGMSLARCIRATAAARMRGSGPDAAIEILRMWGDDDLAAKWAEGRQKALAAGDATAGGFLVPETFSQEIIEFLRNATVMRRLGPRTIPMPTGNISIAKLTSGATASYIGENTNITRSEQQTGQLKLSAKKLAVLTPISNDLIRYSSPGADAVVRDDLVQAMAVREDQAFIRDDGTAGTPKGLLNWAVAANKIAANGTVNLQNVTTDMGKLIQQLKGDNIPMIRPAWIMAPRTRTFLETIQNANGFFVFRDEVLAGRFWGWPIGETNTIPTNLGSGTNESEIYLVDMMQAVLGESLNL
ncbi:MAG: phage major capsid protein, partial [Nitrospinota bacterium]